MKSEITAHPMRLQPEPFQQIRLGKKTIELRLYDEKRRALHIGDEIVFACTADGNQTLRVRVVEMIICDSFEDLYQRVHKQELGYEDSQPASPQDMRAFYSEEEEQKWGVVGIRFVLMTEQTRRLNMSQQISTQSLSHPRSRNIKADFSLNIPIGTDEHGEDIICDFEKTGCTWIQGDVGSGKTTFCKNIIRNLTDRYGDAFDFHVYSAYDEYLDSPQESNPTDGDGIIQPSLHVSSDFSGMLQSLEQLIFKRWTYLDQAEQAASHLMRASWRNYLWNRAFFIFDSFKPAMLVNPDHCSVDNPDHFREIAGTLHRFGERLGIHMIVTTCFPSGSREEDVIRNESRLKILLRTQWNFYFDTFDSWAETKGAEAKSLETGEFFFYRYPHEINSGKGKITAPKESKKADLQQ